MRRESIDADHYPTVLDESRGVGQLQSNEPDLWSHDPRDHLAHPVRVDQLGVVVQEEKNLATRTSSGNIVDPRVIELLLPPQNFEIKIAGVVVVPLLSLGATATVVDNKHIEGRVISSRERG